MTNVRQAARASVARMSEAEKDRVARQVLSIVRDIRRRQLEEARLRREAERRVGM